MVYDVYDVDIAVIQLLEAKGERDDGIVGYDILEIYGVGLRIEKS